LRSSCFKGKITKGVETFSLFVYNVYDKFCAKKFKKGLLLSRTKTRMEMSQWARRIDPDNAKTEGCAMSTATLDISEARREFARLPERLREQQVIWVTKHNKKAFAVVDMELMETVLETLEILRDPEALKILQDSIADIRAGRLIDHEDVGEVLFREDNCEHPCTDPMDGNGTDSPDGSAQKHRPRNLRKNRRSKKI
jgi:PHD/YefM family antitoxin component YafN of YafNO toxin-antitoxin module